MKNKQSPPDDTFQVRCSKLGHQIHFSYCRQENFGIPCPRALICWHPYFKVEEFFRKELTPEQWRDAFEQPVKPKTLSLVELIEEARNRKISSG